MALHRIEREVELDHPVLIVGMEGWIDAGLGAAAAMTALRSTVPTELLASFDGDELIDHRARRPTLRIVDGVNAGLTWPEIELRFGQDRTGRDLLLLVGPEPDMRWHAFTREVGELAQRFGVRLAVGLGAFPAPVPHTRPVRLASTSTSAELAAQVGFVGGTIDVPAGIEAALEREFESVGIPAIGLWARVPHYIAGMPYPAASLALLEGLASLAGIEVDTRELHAATVVTHTRIEQFIANNPEHVDMIRGLEVQLDAEEPAVPSLEQSSLPSGDEIAAELERFLRGEGNPQ